MFLKKMQMMMFYLLDCAFLRYYVACCIFFTLKDVMFGLGVNKKQWAQSFVFVYHPCINSR